MKKESIRERDAPVKGKLKGEKKENVIKKENVGCELKTNTWTIKMLKKEQ